MVVGEGSEVGVAITFSVAEVVPVVTLEEGRDFREGTLLVYSPHPINPPFQTLWTPSSTPLILKDPSLTYLQLLPQTSTTIQTCQLMHRFICPAMLPFKAILCHS